MAMPFVDSINLIVILHGESSEHSIGEFKKEPKKCIRRTIILPFLCAYASIQLNTFLCKHEKTFLRLD